MRGDWYLILNIYFCVCNVYVSCQEFVFCLLYIVNLQDIFVFKFNFVKCLIMFKEIYRKVDSGGFYFGFGSFFFFCWFYDIEGFVKKDILMM